MVDVIGAYDAELADVEDELRLLADDLTRPAEGECLYCYLLRMLDRFGCAGGLSWTLRWCESQRAPYGWVVGWAKRQGGYCDCEVVANAFAEHRRSRRHRMLRCAGSYLGARKTE